MKTPKVVLWSVMLLVTLVVIVTGGEMMVRLIAPQNLSSGWYEEVSRGLVVNAAGATAVHVEGNTRVHYRFNRLHERGGPPDPDAIRILALGDSFTFGWLMEEKKCFVGLLEQRANATFGRNRFQFLNAGTGGWGTADMLAYLESFGAQSHPRAVLLFINFDDVARSWRRGLYVLKDRTGTELIARDAPVQGAAFIRWVRALPGYGWVVRHSHLLQLLRNLLVRQGGIGAPPPVTHVASVRSDAGPADVQKNDRRRLMRGLLRRFKRWADANRVPLYVATTGWAGRRHRWIADIARAEGIDFFDAGPLVRPTVLKDRHRYILTNDGHPNAAGHRLIADAIWPWLEPRLAGLVHERRSSATVRAR